MKSGLRIPGWAKQSLTCKERACVLPHITLFSWKDSVP